MSKPYPIQEVEHENLLLGQKLIELYENRIKTLEEENSNLKLRLTQIPTPNLSPIPNKRKVSTISELREILETRSSKIGKEANEIG